MSASDFELDKTFEDSNLAPFLYIKAHDDMVAWRPGNNPALEGLFQGKQCEVKRSLGSRPVFLEYDPESKILNIDNIFLSPNNSLITGMLFSIIDAARQEQGTVSAISKTLRRADESAICTQIKYSIGTQGPTEVKIDLKGTEIVDGISNITYIFDAKRMVPVINKITKGNIVIDNPQELESFTREYGFPPTIPLLQSREMVTEMTQFDNENPIFPPLKVIGQGNKFTDAVGLTSAKDRPTTVTILGTQPFVKK